MKPKNLARYFAIAFSVLAISGCNLLKASPAQDAGFLPKPNLAMELRERAPFNAYWVFDHKGYEKIRKEYGKVYVAPVDTSIVQAIYKAAKGSEETKTMRIEEVQQLASYFRERLKMNISELQDGVMRLAEQPGDGVLTLRLALVQVVPSNPGVNILGTAAGFLLPGGGLLKLIGEGSVAMEGYVVEHDPESDLFEQFKDREGQKSSPFSLKDYQKYAHIRESIDDWAEQLTLLLTTPSDFQIEDSSVLNLSPL